MWATVRFSAGVRQTVRFGAVFALIFIGLMYIAYDLFGRVPGALVPMEDKGSLIVVGMLPPASSLERTQKVMDFASETVLANPHVDRATAMSGFDITSSSLKSSSGAMFVGLKDWTERTKPEEKSPALAAQFMGQFMQNPDAMLFAMSPPPIMGLSMGGGLKCTFRIAPAAVFNSFRITLIRS
jgi:HAE1 family hydrophobic/amphiphilic exporter-1/multidrug efflux pump